MRSIALAKIITALGVLISLIILMSSHAIAQTAVPMPLEAQRQVAQSKNTIKQLDKLSLLIDQVTQQKSDQCMIAFGTPDFCKCLSENLSVGISFEGYVWSVIRTKDEVQYDNLSNDDQALYDNAIKTRDVCVQWRGK